MNTDEHVFREKTVEALLELLETVKKQQTIIDSLRKQMAAIQAEDSMPSKPVITTQYA